MSTNKTMKNKLVNTMRATKAGTSNADTDSTAAPAEKEAPAVTKAATPAKKPKATKKKMAAKPVSTGFSSPCRVWPD